jgi:hypothetical protein
MNSQALNLNGDVGRMLLLPREIQMLLSEDIEIALVGSLGGARTNPTTDPDELLELFQSHPDCQWSLKLGKIVALEYAPRVGSHALAHLCNNDWDEWPETLQYRWGNSLYLLYQSDATMTRELGGRFPGVSLHNRGLLPTPPSCFGNGPQLHFVRLSASILSLPKWLRSDRRKVEYSDVA